MKKLSKFKKIVTRSKLELTSLEEELNEGI